MSCLEEMLVKPGEGLVIEMLEYNYCGSVFNLGRKGKEDESLEYRWALLTCF